MNAFIKDSYPYYILKLLRGHVDWHKRLFAAPSPNFVKHACLVRNGLPNAVWIETGTYLGQTTHVLSKFASKVYSIEPEPTLFANAKKYFRNHKNVELLNGTSEEIFPNLLAKINGDINFWLDGHYSEGITFQGQQDTPILDELKSISANLSRFHRVCVLVDDVRCFNPSQAAYSTYPAIDVLVDWARSHKLQWHIEHDIFVAKNYTASSVVQL
jgi:hypothetical protein